MAVPALLRKILPQALDSDTFAVSEERPDVTFLNKVKMVVQDNNASGPMSERCLVSPTTARTVAVVDRTADLVQAAKSLVEARFTFGGHSPYAPDVVLVHEYSMKPFVEAMIQFSSKSLADENGRARHSGSRRLSPEPSLLDTAQKDAGSRVLVSGSNWGVVEVHDRYVAPFCYSRRD